MGFDADGTAGYIQAGAVQTAGVMDFFSANAEGREGLTKGDKITDAEAIAKKDAGARMVGSGMMAAGSTVIASSATAGPYFFIPLAIGASIILNGMIIQAIHTRDPVKVAIRNEFLNAGATPKFAAAMGEMLQLSEAEIRDRLEQETRQGGWKSREEEAAATAILSAAALKQSGKAAEIVVASQEGARVEAAAKAQTRNRILVGWFVMLVLMVLVIILRRR